MVWRNVRHVVDEWNVAASRGSAGFTLQLIAPSDAFVSVDKRFCEVAQHSLVALVIPSSEQLNDEEIRLIASMCESHKLPCVFGEAFYHNPSTRYYNSKPCEDTSD